MQPKNGLKIKDFEGNENADELNCLKEELINLIKHQTKVLGLFTKNSKWNE